MRRERAIRGLPGLLLQLVAVDADVLLVRLFDDDDSVPVAGEVSIVVPARDRADQLREALDPLLTLRSRLASQNCCMPSQHACLAYACSAKIGQECRTPATPGLVTHAARSFAFTDDDIVVRDDWVDSLVEAFAAYPHAAAIGGRVLSQDVCSVGSVRE